MKSEIQKVRRLVQGAVLGLAILSVIGCSSSSEKTITKEGVTITEVQTTSTQTRGLEKENSRSEGGEKVAVYLDSSAERVWQNGPSPKAIRNKAYRKKSKARVSGKRDSRGNNTPVLVDIPPRERGPQPFYHGLYP